MARQEIDLTTPQPNGKMGEPTKAAWEKVNDMTADIFSVVSPSSISGLEMSWVSSSSISISSGGAFIESTGTGCINNQSKIVTIGSQFPNSSIGHIYGYESNGIMEFEASSTAPSSPYHGTARSKTGDSSRRYIGSVLKDSSGGVVRFYHSSNNGNYYYLSDINGSGLYILKGGKSSTSVNVSARAVVPLTSRIVFSLMENSGSEIVFISNPDVGPASASNILRFLRANAYTDAEINLDGNGNFNYSFVSEPLGDGLSVWCTGYNYSR